MRKNINFQTAIIKHFVQISSTSFRGEDINKPVDHLYAMIYPYIDDEIDKTQWEGNVDTMDEYEYMMNKIRICTVILYRMGMLPVVKYENRVFEDELQARRSHIDDMAKQVAEEIYFKQILMMHLMSMTDLLKEHLDYNMEMHIDILWMYLSPYITHEDKDNWEVNYKLYETNPQRHDRYYFIERKKRICMQVMDRAGFLWSRSVVDADISDLEEGRFIEDIGSPRPKLPAKMVEDGEDYYDDNDDDSDNKDEYSMDDVVFGDEWVMVN